RFAFLSVTEFLVPHQNRRDELLVQLRRRAHVFQAVVGNFPMTTGVIPGADGASVDALPLRGLNTKRLACEIEIEFEIPVPRRTEEVQRFAQITIRVELVAVPDQVPLRRDAVDR